MFIVSVDLAGAQMVSGTVVDGGGKPVGGAVVTLRTSQGPDVRGRSDDSGAFRLTAGRPGAYELRAETVDHRHGELSIAQAGTGLRIVVGSTGAETTLEFSDKPDFTIAGITDWTAVGGHGSDATLRTSEEMARQTVALRGADAGANALSKGGERLHAEADQHRLAGEQSERAGDPLAAAREEERAATLDPSETNYFTWGAELLVHRAIWQAAEVFARGTRLHPESRRLRTGWGAALFAGAKYDEASARLCEASDLDPADRETYLILGRVGLASPSPEACATERLERFLRMRPEDADANYFVAMTLLKQDPSGGQARATELLRKAVASRPRFANGYLQLGILALARHDEPEALRSFQEAIAADPAQAEAHYRLGVAYDRMGQQEQANAEFAQHEALMKEQADAVERERRQVKQFLVVLGKDAPGESKP